MDLWYDIPIGLDCPLRSSKAHTNISRPPVFVNLGIGENATNFNYTLTQNFWNETGNGTLCVPTLPLPTNLVVTDGTKASIQVVTLGSSGNALYNVSRGSFYTSEISY